MTFDSDGDSMEGADDVGFDLGALRARVERFARLRSAYRALPAVALTSEEIEQQGALADALRLRLSELGRLQSDPEELAKVLAVEHMELDAGLDTIEVEVLDRLDQLDFAGLRASIPKAAETHRHEVIALLEVVLQNRSALLSRLAKVEYLITILSTEDVDGRRSIVHDPVSLTPMLDGIVETPEDTTEIDAIAVEFYQAASLDLDGEQSAQSLRSIRARKEAIGVDCLLPNVLRAVVTYNARMFNWLEAQADSSRQSDAVIDELLKTASEDEIAIPEASDSDADALDRGPVSIATVRASTSVFESTQLETIAEALRRRWKEIPIGSCSSERVALALDRTQLDAIECEAILSESPSKEQEILARTAIVGLILRDMGAVERDLEDLGIDSEVITSIWPAELDEAFGQLVSEKLADVEQYSLASTLSGIKTKHLLAPLAALKGKTGARQPRAAAASQSAAGSDALQEMRQVAREAAGGAGVSQPATDVDAGEFDIPFWKAQRKPIAVAASFLLVALIMGMNLLGARPSTVAELADWDRKRTSPLIESGYRSDRGEGGLVIGRVDAEWASLSAEDRFEEAEDMAMSFERQGILDVMLYDEQGRLQVHYASGQLRRPHRP